MADLQRERDKVVYPPANKKSHHFQQTKLVIIKLQTFIIE